MIFQKTYPFEGTVGENINDGPTLRDDPLSQEEIIELMVLAALESDLFEKCRDGAICLYIRQVIVS